MSIHRICLAGAFVLLGACATPPERAYSPPPLPSSAAPTPVPPPVAIAPTREKIAPAVIAAPAAEPAEPSSAAAPASPAAVAQSPEVAPVPAPKPAPVKMTAPKTAVAAEPAVKPMVKPMPARAAETPAASVEKPEKGTSTRATLQGHVSMVGASGQTVAAGDLADTLVYFVPAAGGERVKPGHFTVYTHNRDFNPEAISVPQGSSVTFVNLDDVRHNVFSVTPGADFNLGYQGSGEKASHTFGHAGVVLVSCNVHRSMELDMLVVPTPYSTKVGANGNFSLKGLPAGAGKLYFWNPRAQLISQSVTLPLRGAIAQKLIASKPHMDTQLNSGNGP